MPVKPLATIRIKIETRTDGTIYISSPDMVGLWLWGKNPDRVFGSIIPTIEELYKHSQGQDVRAEEAPRTGLARWFAQDKVSDRYDIYPVANLGEQTMHGR